MFCSISGQVPEEPVVSKKSGHLYEKRLIVKYIEEQGVCPVTGEPLTVEDLLPVKSSTSNNAGGKESVKAPRPVNATSIPGMLQMFQNEWDALMLETYTLKQHLDAVRQELSHALYQHDAACRVISRLTKERDEARAALASARVNSSEVSEGITKDVVNKINQTAEKLSAARKKRQISPNLASVESIQKYKCTASHPLHSTHPPGITSLAISSANQFMILTGGADGDCILFNKDTGKILTTLSGHTKAVNSVLFHPSLDAMFSCSADKTVRAWSLGENGEYKSSYVLKQHTDSVTGIALHPVGDYLITSSLDRTWSFNDITTGSCLYRSNPENSELTSTAFHPDGLILATGTANGAVKLWDAKAQSEAAEAAGKTAAVTSISFSENGFIMAAGSEDGIIKLWDLRKLNNMHTLKVEGSVQRVTFDHSGNYLAVASNDLRVYQSKVWTELAKLSAHKEKVTDVAFGQDASWIATTSMDRTLKLYTE